MKVLIVDDDPEFRELTIEMIKDIEGIGDFELHEAEDGFDGLIKFINVRPDLVITDYEMPDMNGLVFVHQLRKKDEDVEIILNSSEFQDGEIVGIGSHSSVFKKPIDQEFLESIVKSILSRSKKENSLNK